MITTQDKFQRKFYSSSVAPRCRDETHYLSHHLTRKSADPRREKNGKGWPASEGQLSHNKTSTMERRDFWSQTKVLEMAEKPHKIMIDM